MNARMIPETNPFKEHRPYRGQLQNNMRPLCGREESAFFTPEESSSKMSVVLTVNCTLNLETAE